MYAKQNQKKTSSGSFYEERGKLALSEVMNSDQTPKEISMSTTAQPNQTSFLSLKAHLPLHTENHVLCLLWGTRFPVPLGKFLPMLRVPVRLWKSVYVWLRCQEARGLENNLERRAKHQQLWSQDIHLPSLMPVLCFQGTSRQSCSNTESASFKSTKPGHKHTLDAERTVTN